MERKDSDYQAFSVSIYHHTHNDPNFYEVNSYYSKKQDAHTYHRTVLLQNRDITPHNTLRINQWLAIVQKHVAQLARDGWRIETEVTCDYFDTRETRDFYVTKTAIRAYKETE